MHEPVYEEHYDVKVKTANERFEDVQKQIEILKQKDLELLKSHCALTGNVINVDNKANRIADDLSIVTSRVTATEKHGDELGKRIDDTNEQVDGVNKRVDNAVSDYTDKISEVEANTGKQMDALSKLLHAFMRDSLNHTNIMTIFGLIFAIGITLLIATSLHFGTAVFSIVPMTCIIIGVVMMLGGAFLLVRGAKTIRVKYN